MRKVILNSLLFVFIASHFSTGSADSLWMASLPAANASYFADQQIVARELNDIVFVIIDEKTLADVKAQNDLDSETEADGRILNWFSVVGWKGLFDPLRGGNKNQVQSFQTEQENLPRWGIDSENEFDAEAQSTRQSSIQTKIAARVIEIMPNGFLTLEAKRVLKINGAPLTVGQDSIFEDLKENVRHIGMCLLQFVQ